MFDVALASGGAQITLSTSSDDTHPPENMIDGKDDTFWTTTGLFPQEVVIKFQAQMNIQKVEIASYSVQNIVLETSQNENPDSYEALAERDMECIDHQLQQEDINTGERKCQSLRLVINSGSDHFVSIYKLKVLGTAVPGE